MSTFTPEIETIRSGSFYKAETAYGTEGVGASTPFICMNVLPTLVQSKEVAKAAQGLSLPVGMLAGAEHSTWEGDGALCYEEMKEFFVDYLSHAYTAPAAYTLYNRKLKAVGCALAGFGLSGDTKSMKAKVNFVGKAIVTDGTEQTISTYTAPAFFEAQKTRLSLNNSDWLKLNEWSVDLTGKWDIVDFINPESQSVVSGECDGSFSFKTPLDDNAYDLIHNNAVNTAVISNTTVIGTKTYTFTITFDFMYESVEKPADTNKVWTIGLKGKIINKAPKAIEITVAMSGS